MVTISFIAPAEIGDTVWCIVGKGTTKIVVTRKVSGYTIDNRGVVTGEIEGMRRTFRVVNGLLDDSMGVYFSEEAANAALQQQIAVAIVSATEPLFDWQLWNRTGQNIDAFREKRNRILQTIINSRSAINRLTMAEQAFWRSLFPRNWRVQFNEWCAKAYATSINGQLPEELKKAVETLPPLEDVLPPSESLAGAQARERFINLQEMKYGGYSDEDL